MRLGIEKQAVVQVDVQANMHNDDVFGKKGLVLLTTFPQP